MNMTNEINMKMESMISTVSAEDLINKMLNVKPEEKNEY